MKRLRGTSARLGVGAWSAATVLLVSGATAQGPLSAKVTVTPVAVYTGSSPLPKPQKILVYDFAVNPGDVQVDKVQALRPRHLITGDKSQDAVAASANKTFYQELVKAMAKTGIPVEHVALGTKPSDGVYLAERRHQGGARNHRHGHRVSRCRNQGGCASEDALRHGPAFAISDSDQTRSKYRLRSARGRRIEPRRSCYQINDYRP
jgi:hypothetical protein